MTRPYEVATVSYCTTRPYRVLATFRSFNKGCGNYTTAKAAQRRADALNRCHAAQPVVVQKLMQR